MTGDLDVYFPVSCIRTPLNVGIDGISPVRKKDPGVEMNSSALTSVWSGCRSRCLFTPCWPGLPWTCQRPQAPVGTPLQVELLSLLWQNVTVKCAQRPTATPLSRHHRPCTKTFSWIRGSQRLFSYADLIMRTAFTKKMEPDVAHHVQLHRWLQAWRNTVNPKGIPRETPVECNPKFREKIAVG